MSEADRRAAAQANAAALNTVAGLKVALAVRMGVVAERFPLLETKIEDTEGDEGVSARRPDVVAGWLPPKTDDGLSQFPFMIVRPVSGADSEEGADQNARATFSIIVGTYADDDDGYLDVLLVIDAIRDSLGQHPRLEPTAFEHVGPLTWQVPDQQPRPQWFGVVNTVWSLPRPRRVDLEVL